MVRTAIPTKVYQSILDNGHTFIQTTDPPAWYTGLPKGVQKEIINEQEAVRSVADKVLEITRTSTGGATQQTAPIVAGGVAAAGFLGAVAML